MNEIPAGAEPLAHTSTILIVDDEERNRKLLVLLLRAEGYLTLTAAGASEALAVIAKSPPDLILLDVMMPEMDGYQLAAMLKADSITLSIPIIMLTAQIDQAARLAGLKAGAEEFLTKPFEPVELRLRVRNLLRLKAFSDLQRNHTVLLERLRNVTERKEAEKRLIQMAHFDALTGLPNRTLFYRNLADALDRARARGWCVALLCIDLDHFKNVNDTRGHALGDELLCQVSSRLQQCVRIRDTLARLGGDEFGVILAAREGEQRAQLVANRIREVLSVPFALRDHEVGVTASVGIALYPDDAADAETLIQYADTAMYQSKSAGRNTSRFFKTRMNTDALARLDMETALHKAVENEEFVLHFQPKIEVRSGRVCGLEALLRWQRPGFGLVPPGEFIGVLEDTGLILPVGRWVIAAACGQIGAWLASSVGSVAVSVNVAGRQFIEGDIERDVTRALKEHGIAANLLELEMTESSLMTDAARTVNALQNLRNLGVGVAIDDFGTGYSSLAYLRRFPLDKLKIDMAFIRGITTNADDAAIALAIIRMAHALKLEVIAEGVETAAQLEWLRKHDCDQAQGYLISRPVPAADIDSMLGRSNRHIA
jgi:diguanylate cyclase (GGDEF)-like protein